MEEPPNLKTFAIVIIAWAMLIFILMGLIMFQAVREMRNEVLPILEWPKKEMLLMQGNSLIGVAPLHRPMVLGSLVEVEDALEQIIKRESGGDPSVCSYAGCGSGQGLTQLIPSTVKYCERNLGKTIDPFNAEDNLECARWLLENEGIRHWAPYSGPYNID